jgi:group I intron endonuclease
MPRKAHKYHYIYKTTCNVTEKFYIGMHSCSDLEDGYMGSGKRLLRSLNKYGVENHTKEILEFLPDRKSLAEREREIVNQEMLNEDLCMNLQLGGGGGFSSKKHSDSFHKAGGKAVRQLWSKRNVEKLKSDPEYYDRWHTALIKSREGMPNPFLGKSHTEETKQRISDKAKERIGDKNSQFGTCWITNGIDSTKINKGDSIPDDWKLGRTIKK